MLPNMCHGSISNGTIVTPAKRQMMYIAKVSNRQWPVLRKLYLLNLAGMNFLSAAIPSSSVPTGHTDEQYTLPKINVMAIQNNVAPIAIPDADGTIWALNANEPKRELSVPIVKYAADATINNSDRIMRRVLRFFIASVQR